MSTRNLTMVVDRQQSEKYKLGFAVEPQEVADKSYVNMYLHHDGYPEWRAVELANWVKHMQIDKGFNNFGDGSRVASHLVHDFHYNSQYLYPNLENVDHEYTYIIWTGKPDVWISCYNQYTSECVFVAPIDKIIKKWTVEKYDYTDWNRLNTKDAR
tara:strand:+ start:1593 stop:2060 length:468 start_codon:yes stop_codon:yes gene_type:complete